jgi:hypothetical protein
MTKHVDVFVKQWNAAYPADWHIKYVESLEQFITLSNGLANLQAKAAYVWFSYGVESTPAPVPVKLPTVRLGPTGEWDYPGMGFPKEWDSYSGEAIHNLVQRELMRLKIPYICVDKWG